MCIEAITRNRLRVWLTDEELQQQGLSFARLGNSRVQTDRLLGQLLPLLRRQLPAHAGRLSVEAFPVEGGCVLLVSSAVLPCPGPTVCRLETVQALYALAEHWPTAEADIPMMLYAIEGAFLLVLTPLQPLSAACRAALREYGSAIARGEAAAACGAEHGRLVATGDMPRLLTDGAACPPTPPDQPR